MCLKVCLVVIVVITNITSPYRYLGSSRPRNLGSACIAAFPKRQLSKTESPCNWDELVAYASVSRLGKPFLDHK